MGLAASQARLLLLTARKSDLEFRAQQITNAEMVLAMQTEEVARKYSNALSNQCLKKIDKGTETNISAETIETLLAGTGLIGKQKVGDQWVEVTADKNYSAENLALMYQTGVFDFFTESGEQCGIGSNTQISIGYYQDDDAAAEAEYRRATSALQVKEKRLQMELQQVESQQKACETEMESVKKVIEKNIEKTFKVFS